jgi:hypothetical protein
MSLHKFNNELHKCFDTGELAGYKAQIIASGWNEATENPEFIMFRNHIGREFNKKCVNLGTTGLMFAPFDAGSRPIYSDSSGHPEFHLQSIDGSYLETIDGSHLLLI